MNQEHMFRALPQRTAALLLTALWVFAALLMAPVMPAIADERPQDATLLSGDILDKVTVSFHPAGIQSSLSIKGNGGGAGQNVVHLYNTGDAFRFWLTKADDDSYYIDFFGDSDDYKPSNKRLDLSDSGGYGQSGNVVHVVWRNKDATNKRWRFYRNADGTYYIQNKRSGLYWDLEDGGYSNKNKLCQRELSKAQKWEMEVVHADGKRSIRDLKEYDSYSFQLNGKHVTGANWMGFLPDDMVLSDVTIPGTHDSGTAKMHLMMNATAQCQQLSILDQLYSGVRYFDIRLGIGLALVHGILDLNCLYKGEDLYLERVIGWFMHFLRDNPTETVIIQPQVDTKWEFMLYRAAYDYFEVLAKSRPELVYAGDHVPKLSECRGKIVILSRLSWYDNDDFKTSDGKQWALDVKSWKAWSGDTNAPLALTASGDNYEIWTEDIHTKIDDEKWKIVTNAVFNPQTGAQAKRDDAKAMGRDCWVVSYTSCVNNGNPKKYPQWEARYINPKLVEKLQSDEMKNGQFLGVVCSDFSDQQLAYLVYKQNFIANTKTVTIRGVTQDGAEPIEPMTFQIVKNDTLEQTLGSADMRTQIDQHFGANSNYIPYGYVSNGQRTHEQLRPVPYNQIGSAEAYESYNGYLQKHHGYDTPDTLYVALDRVISYSDPKLKISLELVPPKCGTVITLDADRNWESQEPKPRLSPAGDHTSPVHIRQENGTKKVYWCYEDFVTYPIDGVMTGGKVYSYYFELEPDWGYCFAYYKNYPVQIIDGQADRVIKSVAKSFKVLSDARSVKVSHDLHEIAEKAATCAENGWKHHFYCKNCGKRFSDEAQTKVVSDADVMIPALGHSWGEWTETKAATETTPGEETRTCSRCDEKEVRVIPIKSHVHGLVEVHQKAATCEENGSKGYWVCAEGEYPCHRYFSDAEGTKEINREDAVIPALGHIWLDPQYTWAEDDSTATGTRVCLRDHTHILTETANATAVITKEAACEDTGIKHLTVEFISSLFSVQEKDAELPALGHSWDGGKREGLPASCTIEGKMRYTCTRCQATKTEKVPKTAHTPKSTIRETSATCTAAGSRSIIVKCSKCGTVIEAERSEAIPALGHNWLEPTYTWSSDNKKVTATHICARDASHVETETVDAFYAEIPATCESEGVREWYSDEFKNEDFAIQEKDKEILPAIGHDWGAWVITKEPTETENGLQTRTCRHDASHVQTQVIPASRHEHHLSHVEAKEPTCEETGNIEYWVCDQGTDACGKFFSDEAGKTKISEADTLISALGHSWSEWTVSSRASCIHKGAEKRVCSRNALHVETRETPIDSDEHDWGEWQVIQKATATKVGSKFHVCILNEAHREEQTIPSATAPTALTGLIYDTTAQVLITAGTAPAGVEMQYALGPDSATAPTKDWSASLPTGTNAGTYYVWYRLTGDEIEYASDAGVVIAEIGKASLTDAVLEKSVLRYTGQELTAKVAQVKAGNLIVPPKAYTVSGNSGTEAGKYTLEITPLEDSNFMLKLQKEFRIEMSTEKLFEVDLVTYDFVYTGLPQTPGVIAKDIDTGLEIGSQNYDVVYSNNTNAGFAEAKVTGKNEYASTDEPWTITFRIAPAPLTVKAKDKTIFYGDAPANDGVTYAGFVTGEDERELDGTLTYDYSYSQYDDVGSYSITPGGLSSRKDSSISYHPGNYKITFSPGTLHVEPKTVGLEWSTETLTYNGSEQAPAVTATGLVNGDAIGVTVTGGQTNAGTYTATADSLNGVKAGNYVLPTERTASFTIAKAPNPAAVSGTAAVRIGGTVDLSKNVKLNGADGTVSYRIIGEKQGCIVNDQGVLTSGQSTGIVTVQVAVAEGQNYLALEDTAAKPNTITVTIIDRETQLLTFAENPVTKTFGDDPFINRLSGVKTYVTYAVTEGAEVAEIAPDGTVTIKAAGEAVITATAVETEAVAGATASYTLKVEKAPSGIIPPEVKPGLVDIGAPQELVTAGTALGGDLLYAVTREKIPPYENEYSPLIPRETDAGLYFVWYRVKGDGNHLDTPPAFLLVTISDELVYQAVSGAGQNHVRGSGLDAVFTLKGTPKDNAYEAMAEARVGGAVLLENSYTRARGSLILTLKAGYLDTLATGPQTLSVLFENNQQVDIPFTVSEAPREEASPAPEPEVPKTGDGGNPALWLGLVVAGVGLAVLLVFRRKK